MECAAVIWDALKAACEADHVTAKAIIESAGIIVRKADMTVCYDELGAPLKESAISVANFTDFLILDEHTYEPEGKSDASVEQFRLKLYDRVWLPMSTSNSVLILFYLGAGSKYELPKYVLSRPTNLLHDAPAADVEMLNREAK